MDNRIDIRALAREIARLNYSSVGSVVDGAWRRGIVASVNGNKASVYIDGSPNVTPNLICIESYVPKVGDQVIIARIGDSGANFVVLGAVSTSGQLKPMFRARRTSNYTVPNSTFTKVPFNSKQYDTTGSFSTSNNSFTAPKPGVYRFTANIALEKTTNQYRYIITFFINGSEAQRGFDGYYGGTGATGQRNITAPFYLEKGDVVDVRLWHNVGSTRTETGNNSVFFAGEMIG